MGQQSPQPPDDEDLDALFERDPNIAFRRWWETAEPRRVLSRIAGLCRRFDQAPQPEDVLQEALVLAIRKIAQFDRTKGTFAKWFRKIAAHALYNMMRSPQWRHHKSLEDNLLPCPGGDNRPIEPAATAGRDDDNDEVRHRLDEQMEKIREFIPRLGSVQRGAIELWLDGATTAEIAERLGTTEQSIRVSLAKAKGNLRKWLVPSHDVCG